VVTTHAEGILTRKLLPGALTIREKLNIANRPRADLNFVPKGTPFVYITLAGDQIVVSRWLYLGFSSISDHPYIYFEVELDGMASQPTNPSAARKASALSCINKTRRRKSSLITTQLGAAFCIRSISRVY
jgi:hypothetical protein